MNDFKLIDFTMMKIRGVNKEKWTKSIDKPNLKVYYQQVKGNAQCTLYMDTVIKAPLFNLIAVIAEAQLYKTWIP